MNEDVERIRPSVNWGGRVKRLNMLVAVALMLSLVMPLAAPLAQQAARIQPLLMQLAAQDPDQTVSVIVQKAVKDDRVERAVASLDGYITKDLHIINAFAAEMKVKDAAQLAKTDGVRWVSLDATVQKSILPDDTIADFFSTVSYSNNNGSKSWLNAWTETGETTSPSAGYIRIVSGQLRLSSTSRTIRRSANLSQATSAMLSFTYKRSSFTSSSHKAVVQASKDGGAAWVTLATIAGPGSDANPVAASFDLTPFLSANTAIRFAITSGTSNYLYIDDVAITYKQPLALPPLPPAGTILPHNVEDDLYAPAILDFRHNSGTRNWTSPWNEMGENDGPAAGNIRLERNDSWDRIVIQEQANDADGWTRVKGVGRATDLSTATTAVLSFVYKRVSMEGNDFVKLEITSDRGATWYEIARFGAAADATFQSVS